MAKITSFLLAFALLFACFNPFYVSVLKELETLATHSFDTLVLLEELLIAVKTLGRSKIPLLSSFFSSNADSLQNITQFVSYSTLCLTAELFLVKLFQSKLVIGALAIIWLFSFHKKKGIIASRIVLIGLLLNPGLSMVTMGLTMLYNETHFSTTSNIHQEVALFHKDYLAKENKIKQNIQNKEEVQLERDAKVKPKKDTVISDSLFTDSLAEEQWPEEEENKKEVKLTVFQKDMDELKEKTDNVATHASMDYAILKKTLKMANKNLIPLSINYFMAILFLHILLPMGYLFFMYRFIRKVMYNS